MDAVYSGQAGTLALIEGANVELAFAALPERSKRIAREGVRYVFLGCNDIVTVRGANRAEVFSHFMKAWRCDRSLRLFLLLLDSEEDVALREEAADCLEEFFTQSDTIAHVENQLYSRPLPINADLSIIRKNQSKWPNTSQVVLKLTKNQDAIHRHREAWDKLPESLFGDVAEKIAFEEEAIERGAFRTLAITPSNAANLAILACHKALASLPEGRHIVSEWTKGFKKSETKTPLLPEDDIEPELQPLYSRAAFENALRQQEGIFTQMRSGNLVLARRFADQLVDFQLGSGGDRFAAKSLCRLAQEAKYLGLFSLQLEWAQRATVVCPADAWAHGQAADALLQYFRLDEALAELELCESYGDAAFAATGRAKVLRLRGHLAEAVDAYRAAREKFAGREEAVAAWAGSAETLREMWKLDEALFEYDQAIERHPQELLLRCGRASVLTELGRLEDALAAYDAILASQDDLVALNGKASVLKQMGRLEDSLNVYARIRALYPTDPVALCGQADVLRLQENFDQALELYAKTKRDYPSLPVAYSGYAQVLRDMGRLSESIAAYRGAHERFPFEPRLANGYANVRKVNKEYAEALQQYDQNATQFPYSLISKIGRADLLRRLGRYHDALEAYDEIIKVWPAYLTARVAKASVLVLLSDLKNAETLLPKTPPKTREDWIAFHVRGMILLRQKKFDEAIGHFSKGSSTIPFKREQRFFDSALCVARIQKGQFQDAVRAIENVEGEVPNVLRFHALAGTGNRTRTGAAYKRLSINAPPELLELTQEIAARFRVINELPAHNDNWIFEKEAELLLQEAA